MGNLYEDHQPERASARQALTALVAGLVFVASVVGAFSQSRADAKLQAATSATTTAAPVTVVETTTSAPPPPRPGIPGFSGIEYVVATPTGEEKRCALLAETPEQQAQGLMRSPSLGGYDAMVFRFPADTLAQFYTANVPMPLSIAFYGADGAFIESRDMPLCTSEPGQCPTYGPGRPYRWAFEVPLGGLAAAGLGAGTTVNLGGPCG